MPRVGAANSMNSTPVAPVLVGFGRLDAQGISAFGVPMIAGNSRLKLFACFLLYCVDGQVAHHDFEVFGCAREKHVGLRVEFESFLGVPSHTWIENRFGIAVFLEKAGRKSGPNNQAGRQSRWDFDFYMRVIDFEIERFARRLNLQVSCESIVDSLQELELHGQFDFILDRDV